jgi:dTDP-4-amino-4,6-dideoxygalactose transaminase
MDDIMVLARDAGLVVIEDAACALGTTFAGRQVGTFGQAGCFSFHPRKAITTGEGGAVVTNDPEICEAVTLLRNHGLKRCADGAFDLVSPGLNWRMTEFQASLGLSQLKRFQVALGIRQRIASLYLEELRELHGLQLPAAVPGHAWQTFMVVLPQHVSRSVVTRELHNRGVEAGVGAYAVHLLSYYRERYRYDPDDFPVAKTLYSRGLALPLHDSLGEDDVRIVIRALRELWAESAA